MTAQLNEITNVTLEQFTNKTFGGPSSSYLAPEIGYSPRYDHRVDVYSFGVVMYEMLTAEKLPFNRVCQLLKSLLSF